MPLLRRVAPVLLAVGLVAGGAGCGGSSRPGAATGVKPAAWARSVCTALSPWRAQLTSLTDEAQRQLTSTTTPAQAKENLVGLLAGAEKASEAARGQVAAAGTPAVAQGGDIAARFVTSLQAARDAYAHARGTVAGLDAGNAQAFYAEVANAFEKLQHEYAASALDTGKISSAPLRQAFNEVPECR